MTAVKWLHFLDWIRKKKKGKNLFSDRSFPKQDESVYALDRFIAPFIYKFFFIFIFEGRDFRKGKGH